MSKSVHLFNCRICGNNKDNDEYYITEMMFGFRDKFKYIKCSNCGCLQIEEIPANIKKYYPPNYYSFSDKENYFRRILNKKRDKFSNGYNSLIGKYLVNKYGHSELFNWLKEVNIKSEDKILDIGCGDGKILYKLADWGMNNLTGIDPFIIRSRTYKNKIKIIKSTLEELNCEQYDLIMLHHSLEHMEHQFDTLKKVNQLLKLNKVVIVRIPVIDTVAWKEYGTNWVQIDAPRHFFLHSTKSMNYLAEKTGFRVYKTKFDSSSFQFWGSEQYRRNIPLHSKQSYLVNPSKSIFDAAEIKQYETRAKELNEAQLGDQAVFYLRKIM